MAQPNCFIFYVDNPVASVRLYSDLLGRAPVESSNDFAMFRLDSGAMLGLWRKPAVTPAVPVGASGGEWAFSVEDAAQVDALHDSWQLRGMAIVQTPTRLDFGYSFVAIDHDGHRLRVYAPEPA